MGEMGRHNCSMKVPHKHSNEGTAARTRPFSLEEILLIRKKKINIYDKEGGGEMRDSSEKDYLDWGIESKESKNTVKGNSKTLEEAILKSEHENFEMKDKENHDLEASLKSSYNMNTNKDIKNEKHIHHRTRTSNYSGADTKMESEKNPVKVSIEKNKREDRERKSGKERKRKHESHIDDKIRSTIDGSIWKKHDLGKSDDAEYPERRDRKKEYHRTRNEELNCVDDKSRSATDGSICKEHESGKLCDAECSERKDQKKEHRQTHHEEPNCIDDKHRPVTDGCILKKHDSGKLHDAQYSERKERKKEHPLTHLEEPNCIDNRNRSVIDGSNMKKQNSSKSYNAEYSERKDWKKEHPGNHCEEPKCIDDKSRSAIEGSIAKKHDSGKSRDVEYLERKDRKKEHSRTHYEEPKKRSRSRDYDHERDRSSSMSPRAYRYSDHVRSYDELVSESSKDKSRRKYSEVDRYRNSENGGYGSRHYRKQGSGLGGYSPRKRTESAAKSPPPTRRSRSPEKKSSTWDQPPAGSSHGGSGSMFAGFLPHSTNALELVSSSAVTSSVTKHQPIPSINSISMPLNVSVDSVQLTQATRPMRRLYIENLSPSASEKSVIDCLNDILLSSGVNRVQGAKPCISCIINKEKCQAVVEFLTPEDATSAISFDGKSLLGSVLKIRRPKDFVEVATGLAEKIVPMVKAISEVVKDSPYKIFIGGISKSLSADMLREVVGAFGLLRAYHFEFNEELNASCAFLEYDDHSITQKACAGLNGMKLGGQVLTAVQAFLDSREERDAAENHPSYDIPLNAKSLLVDSTQVLQLKNVFKPDEFPPLSDSELEEILEDIRLECTRFGTVKSINVVRLNRKSECATEVSDQHDPHASDSAKIQAGTNVDVSASRLSDKELQEVKGDTKSTNSNDVNPVEDHEMKESANPRPTNIRVEKSIGLESDSVSEIPFQQSGMENTSNLVAHECNGGDEKLQVEITNKAGNGGDCNNQTSDLETFEPGSVLVEFLRKEAACAAAHCLHLRCYGEQTVWVSYISHDLYTKTFPR